MPPFPIFPSSPASSISGARNDKEKEKGVNVQVLLRCRPFNEEELRVNAPQVISCNEQRREVSVNLNIASKQIDRTFTFDKVFGPQAQQKDLYDQAVVPIVNEVLEGFNCTIFAYGQTGTGKTYTMEGGGKKSKSGDLSVDAGVIPRAVQQIFDTLESQNAEYSMKVTFLELYNEELTDLMAPDDLSRSVEDKQRKPLALMEDGKGGVLVRGLEEEIVYSANEIYNLLERGSAKRRTAETLLNKQSSRSHSIFSIIIHIKEATPEGEELIKCGKLNLVDLAGSENISRSGAREGRAREAGEINKSLLTLGRVITALVEHLGHVPYRDSKLTRLLRDSLGGRTKTCIIATVSPSVHCLEETLSTLDYAHRAKNIKNKPEVNQKMMKSTLIKDLYSEIEKLKTEVHAAREKNGIYLPRERYFQDEAERKAMSEKIEHMEFELEAKDKQVDEMQESLDSQQQLCAEVNANLESTQKILEQTQDALAEAKESIKQSQYTIKEREYIITNMEESENTLVKRASNLQSDLESSVNDIAGLHLKIDRKDKVETENHRLVQGFHTQLAQNLETLHSTVTESVAQQQQQLQNVEQQLKSFLASKNESTEGLKNQVLHLKDAYCSGLRSLQELICSHEKDSSSTFGKLNTTVSAHASAIEVFLAEAVSKADMVLTDLQIALHDQESAIASFTQQQREGAQQRIEATRAISNVLVDFFEILEGSTTELCTSTQDNQQTQHQSLAELERTYEECSKQEEQQLLEKITEMLAAATARKTELVRSKVSRMQDDVGKNSNNMQQGIITIHNVTSGVQNQWNTYTQQTEDSHRKGSAALAAKHCNFEELLQRCVKSATMAGEQWKTSQESLQQLEKSNLLAADSVVKEGIYGNGLLLTNFERLSASIQSDVQTGNGSVLESVTSSLHLDQEAGASLLSTAASKSLALTELQTCHHNGTVEIKDQADHCLNEEYLEDKPTCTTPKKRSIDVPSKASIEALRTPCVEKLLQDFRATHGSTIPEKSSSQKSFTSRESKIPIPADSSLLKDGRVPLTAVN